MSSETDHPGAAAAPLTRATLLGTVVRLQVQREPVKQGDRGHREYLPEKIAAVVELEISDRGNRGVTDTGERILDVHHRDHPASRDPKGRSGLTVMTVADYDWLRDRFGDHLVDGIAGESVLIDGPPMAGNSYPDGLLAETEAAVVALGAVRVADPCIEFTRFCLGLPAVSPVDAELRAVLAELGGGRRGYRAVSGDGVLRSGDRLYAAAPG